ncbi:hypothetical protein HK098_004683 [Nowakowskiella sp. JEL0407]|nr:hypothetical protein HK098_004683 [Nowakowskiella sp. JEL0407]
MSKQSPWSETAQAAIQEAADRHSPASSIHSPTATSNYPPETTPTVPPRRGTTKKQTPANRISVYENMGLPEEDISGDMWAPSYSSPSPHANASSYTNTFNNGGYTQVGQPQLSVYDEKRKLQFEARQKSDNFGRGSYTKSNGSGLSNLYSIYDNVAQSTYYEKAGGSSSGFEKSGGLKVDDTKLKRRSHHIEEVQEVFTSERTENPTLKWKWKRPDGRNETTGMKRRRILGMVFIVIALTSGASAGLASTLINHSITPSDGIPASMLKPSFEMYFSLFTSLLSFLLSTLCSISFFLPPHALETRVSKLVGRYTSFPTRAMLALAFLCILIASWAAVVSISVVTRITCWKLGFLVTNDDQKEFVSIGRRMNLSDCKINDALLSLAVVGVFEWGVAFLSVVEGHARRMALMTND